MPVATTSQWKISFRKQSLTDSRLFWVNLAATTPKAVVTALAAELKKLGYEDIAISFDLVLP